MDIERLIRKIEKATGCDICLARDEAGKPTEASTNDWELRGRRFSVTLGPASAHEKQLKSLHSSIYSERGKEQFRRQKGICAICGKKMSGTYNTEIDHIIPRSKGRSDVLSNLRAVHGRPCHYNRHNKGYANA